MVLRSCFRLKMKKYILARGTSVPHSCRERIAVLNKKLNGHGGGNDMMIAGKDMFQQIGWNIDNLAIGPEIRRGDAFLASPFAFLR